MSDGEHRATPFSGRLLALAIVFVALTGCGGQRDPLFRDPLADVDLAIAVDISRTAQDSRGGGCRSPLPARITQVFAPATGLNAAQLRDQLAQFARDEGWSVEGGPPDAVLLGEKTIDGAVATLSLNTEDGRVVLIVGR